MSWSDTPSPRDFPDPHLFATWMTDRSPQFKTHSTQAHVKNAITGKIRYGVLPCDVYIYQYDEDLAEWLQLHHIAKGTAKEDHAFFRAKTPRKKREPKPVTEKALNDAIASITGGPDGV